MPTKQDKRLLDADKKLRLSVLQKVIVVHTPFEQKIDEPLLIMGEQENEIE